MDKRKECIIVIDPQKDFTCQEGAYSQRHTGINQILEAKLRIEQFLALYDNPNIAIVFSNYCIDQFGKNLSLCIPGTVGHDLDIELPSLCKLIAKSHQSAFSSQEFVSFLQMNHLKRLVLCGFLAEYCVRSTLLDAIEHQYEVVVLEDCIGTGDDVQIRKKQMLDEFKRRGVSILNSNDFLHNKELNE